MKILIILACVCALAGCTSVGELKTTAQGPSGNESIYVIGVSPANFRVSVWPGKVKNGRFYKSQLRNANLYGAAHDGFVVGTAKAGQTLSITNVRIVNNDHSILGPDFGPCQDALVFKIPKGGEVLYLGNIVFSYDGSMVHVRTSNDIAAVRQFLTATYPNIHQPVVQMAFMHMPMPRLGCTVAISQ